MRLGFNPIAGSFDFQGPQEQIVDTVDALSSKVVESIDLNDFLAIDYGFHLTDGTKTRSFRCIVTQDSGAVSDQVFARSGSLSIAVGVTISAGSMEIEITNNETTSIDLTFTRLIL